MVSKRKPSKTFPREFKLEALRQLEASTRPATELVKELGIRANQLYKWREQLITKGEKTFPDKCVKSDRPKKEDQSKLVTLQ